MIRCLGLTYFILAISAAYSNLRKILLPNYFTYEVQVQDSVLLTLYFTFHHLSFLKCIKYIREHYRQSV